MRCIQLIQSTIASCTYWRRNMTGPNDGDAVSCGLNFCPKETNRLNAMQLHMPHRKRKRATSIADSSDPCKSEACRKRMSHHVADDAHDQDMQQVSRLQCVALMTNLLTRGAESMKTDHPCFRASLKLSFANQVLKDTILELLRKRKPGSSC